MAKNIEKIAVGLGAKVVAQVPDTGGGAFGAARLARIAATIQARLGPGKVSVQAGQLMQAGCGIPRCR